MKENTQGIRVININDSEEIWGRFLERKEGPFNSKVIQKSTITKISRLLFKDISKEQMKVFEKLVRHEFSWHKCVCIRSLSPVYFGKFCKEYKFEDIGRKEVILKSDGKTILFTEDSKRHPNAIRN